MKKDQSIVKTYKGPGSRTKNLPQPSHSFHKWRNVRWLTLIAINFLFFASFYFDIQILEGSLSGSRLLGFHLADPLAALQVIFASKILMINLLIGGVTIVIFYLLFGGRSFCSWLCPYHIIAEFGEKIHEKLLAKKKIKAHKFDRKIRFYLFALFLILSAATGYTIFEVINPVAILSRFIVYGFSLMLIWVLVLLLFEVFYSQRAWCRYFCPVGVSYNLIGFLTPLRIKWDRNNCSNCKRCQKVCLVPYVLSESVNKGNTDYVNSGDCTRCGLCIDICDDEALSFKFKYLDKII